uniref:Uncharacterized protein n=1 Tax=Coptotermes formosanus TaxID=36987 RepID=R4V0U2_COPFO|nr:hypothetical protein [Coptotermes formosanus]
MGRVRELDERITVLKKDIEREKADYDDLIQKIEGTAHRERKLIGKPITLELLEPKITLYQTQLIEMRQMVGEYTLMIEQLENTLAESNKKTPIATPKTSDKAIKLKTQNRNIVRKKARRCS